jgi:hypothetical protein
MRKYIRQLKARWTKKRPHPRQAVFNEKGFVGYRARFDHDDRNTVVKSVVDDRGQIFNRMRNGQVVNTRKVASEEIVLKHREARRKQQAQAQTSPKKTEENLAAQMFKNIWGKLFKRGSFNGKAKR